MSDARALVAVHGGAGDVLDARRPLHVEAAKRAAAAGRDVLARGGSPLDAAQAAVEVLEDDPLFNAGTGACLTAAGTLELDASLMEGTSLRAGAVAALPPFTHPIAVARAALDDGRHVLYAAHGALALAVKAGFTPSTLEAMRTPEAAARLELVLAGRASPGWAGGTVGAVARDAQGRVAAATSTGGTVGKLPGRIGDSPLIGCGTYADDEGGACSATGDGEAIIRATLARTVVDLMRGGVPAPEAARAAVATLGARFAATGGLVVVDRRGHVGFAWSTRTMSHAVAYVGGDVEGGS